MAQKVSVILVCDLHDDETEGSETVSFGLDGSAYEIDLCEEHASALRDDLASYVGAARRAGRTAPAQRRSGSGSGGRTKAAASGDKAAVSDVREWARANGHQVSERGRIAASVLEAYEAAH